MTNGQTEKKRWGEDIDYIPDNSQILLLLTTCIQPSTKIKLLFLSNKMLKKSQLHPNPEIVGRPKWGNAWWDFWLLRGGTWPNRASTWLSQPPTLPSSEPWQTAAWSRGSDRSRLDVGDSSPRDRYRLSPSPVSTPGLLYGSQLDSFEVGRWWDRPVIRDATPLPRDPTDLFVSPHRLVFGKRRRTKAWVVMRKNISRGLGSGFMC